ncbi:interferon-induced transmembrane protein 1-like [Nyctibius grandis]|uniref:interferon-induced transmembrane protein 1-like n=1 Tax=Nyctibius grandis TaxID=48427 RepID=UPI0035BBB449
MENYPQSVSINMQPYSKNGPGSSAAAFDPTTTPFAQPDPVPMPIPMPRDFVLWSLFNTIFCNAFCLGFVALIYSIKSRDRTIAQDPVAATGYGRTAKILNAIALCLGVAVTILCIVLFYQYFSILQQYKQP